MKNENLNNEEIRITGNYCNYHNNYIAIIIGLSEKFGFERKFGKRVNLTWSGKNGEVEEISLENVLK